MRGQQRKVSRPTSFSFDQLSMMQNDVITAEIDNKNSQENQADSKTANVVSSVLKKYKAPVEVAK